MKKFGKKLLASCGGLLALTPAAAWACACGCGVFEVGPNMILSMSPGVTLFSEFDFMDQNTNWSGTARAPATASDDKEIKSEFFTFGGSAVIDQDWSVVAEIPVSNRTFKNDTGDGSTDTFHHAALGDIRLMGIYSGLSDDMSTGVIFGVKLPTGDFRYPNLDRDTEIGSGSTDLLIGLTHTGTISPDGDWTWYGQILWDKPLASQGGYTPGGEVDAALGVGYRGFSASNGVQIAPSLQLVGSNRAKDSGINADPPSTGHDRILLSPGVAISYDRWRIYGDVEIPLYQDVNGNQLTAHQLCKFVVSYNLEG